MSKGLFIVFEGIDGSGKSSLARALHEYLSNKNILSTLTAEPTSDTLIGKTLRAYLKDSSVDESTMALLFAADRVEHVKEIKKLLDEGTTVICDRYIYSNFAYQGEFPSREIHNLLRDKLLIPDITFYVDADPEICLERIKSRSLELDKYETIDKLNKIRKNYMSIVSLNSPRYDHPKFHNLEKLVHSYFGFSNEPFIIDKNFTLEEAIKEVIRIYSEVAKVSEEN